ADAKLVDRDLLDGAVPGTVGDPWGAVDPKPELPPCPPGPPRLGRAAAGHPQRDDRGGELLAKDERTGDRDEGNRIDARVAAEQAPGGVDGEREEDDRRSDAPRRVGPVRLAGQPEDPAGEERGERGGGQGALAHPYPGARL